MRSLSLLPLLPWMLAGACTPVPSSQGWSVPLSPLPADAPAPALSDPGDVFAGDAPVLGAPTAPSAQDEPSPGADEADVGAAPVALDGSDASDAPGASAAPTDPFTVAPPDPEPRANAEDAPSEPPGAGGGWSPRDPVDVAWGVRLIGTLPSSQPPRAILALGSGQERVVEPGTMVPEASLVVLAIGERAVQVAHVRADGDRARVETEILYPFYDRSRRGPLTP